MKEPNVYTPAFEWISKEELARQIGVAPFKVRTIYRQVKSQGLLKLGHTHQKMGNASNAEVLYHRYNFGTAISSLNAGEFTQEEEPEEPKKGKKPKVVKFTPVAP